MGADIELMGVGELLDQLNRYADQLSSIEDEALKTAAEPILKDAKQSTKFSDRTGTLRKSLKISKVKKGTKYKCKYIQILTASPHAHLVEFGHSGKYAAARPFLAPAFERHQAEAVEIIARKLREALK